jgi:Leucine-rich repeat (LRR) protein
MLQKLEHLSLYVNPSLTIPIDGIENARSLRQLVLDSNGITSIEGIGQVRSLTELNVEDNELEGELPDELSRLVHLRSLSVSKNSFKGTIRSRPFWPRTTNLKVLCQILPVLRGSLIDLSNNRLIGEIPRSFLRFVSEREKIVVDLSNNSIEGYL